jgi:class 3 adenylate cyclase/TolB-like protein/tetratricopeptide (TPR) repeat protein
MHGMSAAWSFEQTASRRAILFADLVESVRLFQDHPSLIDTWRQYAAAVRDEVAPACGGRLVRTAGDGLLLQFDHAALAVRAAHELHDRLARLNAADNAAQDRMMWLRIGLHVADVVADEHELWGSGVNLAARVATLAQPGQSIATDVARAALDDGVHTVIEDLGERYLKHIAEPVRAFLLHPPGSSLARRALPQSDLRPAVAVVPFSALPADPAHDALGFALADDIIASLSRHSGLRVQSRASTAAVRGQVLELPRLRELLGASFMLSGQFYVRGARVRLTAELCELAGGQVLWTGTVTGDVDALFEGQDEVVPHLVAQVSQHVLAHELSRVRSLPMDSLASYSLLLGAGGLLNSLTQRDFGRAYEVLDHLAERHPRQGTPHAMLSEWHVFKLLQGWTDDPRTESLRAAKRAQEAIEREPDLPAALVADGVAKVFLDRDFAGAGKQFEKALEIDPHHVHAWARLSETLSEAGQHQEALDAVTRAIDLSPMDPRRFIHECYAARTLYVLGRYAEAANHARASVRRHALHAPSHRLLIASMWMDGRQEAAREAASNYVRLLPGANVSGSPSVEGSRVVTTPFARALHAAGVPL